MPFSDAPVLEIGGRVVLQTSAITRFVAVHCRLVPIVHAEQTVAESVVDSAIELRAAGFQAFFDDSLKVRGTCNSQTDLKIKVILHVCTYTSRCRSGTGALPRWHWMFAYVI